MKVLFVYPNPLDYLWMQMGISYLSAALKQVGHKTSLLDTTTQVFGALTDDKIVRSVKKFNPDLVGVSSDSCSFSQAIKVSRVIKEAFDIPIVFGGHHATVAPEEVLSYDLIDMVCIGEGDYAFLELIERIETNRNYTNTKNFWIKKNNQIYKNPVRPLIQNLDQLPFPDRDLWDRRHIHLSYPHGTPFLTSRGCPFNCSYCHNSYLQRLYQGKGRFVRFRSVDNILQEIQLVQEKYNIKRIMFFDDTFTLNKRRIDEFCQRYASEVGLPFVIQTRPDTLNMEILMLLKKAGCEVIMLGVEAGNDFIRKTILRRKMSRSQILKVFRLARELKIQTASFNMIGAPYETLETIWESIELNRRANPNRILHTILMPFKGTDIRKIYDEKGWLLESDSAPISYYTEITIKLPSMSTEELLIFQRFFGLYSRLPRGVDRVAHKLLCLPATFYLQNKNRLSRSLLKKLVGSVIDRLTPLY